MDNRITNKLVRSFYSPTVFRRGEEYFKTGRVSQLSYDQLSKTWTAVVKGNERYQVYIKIDENSIEDDCTCKAYQTYGDCKHICAALLAMANMKTSESKQNKSSKNVRYQNAQNLIDFLREQPTEEQDSMRSGREPLNVEFLLRTESAGIHVKNEQFLVEMKMGPKRLYVVKEIRELLSAIVNREVLKFGKHFTYDDRNYYFYPEDLEIIELLIEVYQTEDLYNRNVTHYWQTPTKKGKDLLIPPYAADTLLMKIKDRNCQYSNENIINGQLKIGEDALPFSFSLENGQAQEYRLKISTNGKGTYYEKYGWYADRSTLSKLSKENQAIMKQLIPLMGNKPNSLISISKDQIGTFVSQALPKIKRIGKVKVAAKVASIIISPPLKIKMFVGGNSERIDVKVEYHYDAIVINPMKQSSEIGINAKTILVRDEVKELNFMNLLELTPLKVNDDHLYTDTEDGVFEFLYESMGSMGEVADIYLDSSVKSLLLPSAARARVEANIQSDGNLLEIDFSIDGIDRERVPYILQAVVEKKRYTRLPDGAFLSLADDQLQDVANLYKELNIQSEDFEKGKVKLPVYKGLQVEEQLSGLDKRSKKFGKAFRQFVDSIKSPEEEEFILPDTLQANLREYQLTGFQWLKSLARYQLGGILADDMGLGKTLQSIAFILSERKESESNKPFLVVAPASLVYNWKNEFSKFAPELNVEIAIGTVQERKAVQERESMPDIFITSYQTLRQDIEWYREQEFLALILDEAQAVKNYASKTAQAVREIKATKKFALSGTPIENSLDELWSIFETIIPGFFKDQKTFRSMEPEYISRLVKPFILRRLKQDVLKELPDKIEMVQHSELTKEQKELYLAYLNKIRTETKESLATEGIGKGRIKILAGLTRLRQLCCHPSLFIENYKGHSGKLEQLLEIVGNAMENGRRILIFSQFASMLKIIQEHLAQDGLDCYYLDGQTPAKDRVKMVDQFNDGDKSIFLISLKAGGTGLNLTGADTVVLFDLWWNPAIEDQAVGRAHRMGQKNVVQVIKLISRGTIEEKINELQQSKKELIDRVIQSGETMLTSLSEADIREILSI